MTVSDKVWENEKGSGTRQERPPPFYLCCHLVLTIHFPLFPLSLTLPSSVTLPISANCSFLILSPLTPQGSLSFPAFSSCFIYSLFNSLRCICFPFLSPWHPSPPALTTSLWFIYSFSRPLLVHHLASLSLSLLYLPHSLKTLSSLFISLGGSFHFLYNSCSSLFVMQDFLFI